MTWLEDVTVALAKVERKDGAIEVTSYVAFVELVPPLYNMLFNTGVIANQLKGDLTGSLGIVKNACKRLGGADTLTAMLTLEVAGKNGDVRKCKYATNGVVGLLWLNRALHYITLLVKGLHEGATSKEAARAAYNGALKPYHGWMTSKFVGAAMGMCPGKSDILKKLGITHPDELQSFVGLLEPIVQETLALLDSSGCNYPDKV